MYSLLIQHGNGKALRDFMKKAVASFESRDKSNLTKCHCNWDPRRADPT